MFVLFPVQKLYVKNWLDWNEAASDGAIFVMCALVNMRGCSSPGRTENQAPLRFLSRGVLLSAPQQKLDSKGANLRYRPEAELLGFNDESLLSAKSRPSANCQNTMHNQSFGICS